MKRNFPVFNILVFIIVSLLGPAAAGPAPAVFAQSPYPERRGIVANGTSLAVSDVRINSEFTERIGVTYGLEGLVLMVDNCQPDPEVYLDGALVHYGLADGPGAMHNNAVAWLVCLDPRFAGFFYAAQNPHAAAFDSQAVHDAMVADLAAQNFTGAVTSAFDLVAGQLASGAAPGAAGPEVAAGSSQSQPASTAPDNNSSGNENTATQLLALGALGLGGYWLWRHGRPASVSDRAAKEGAADGSGDGAADPLAALQAKTAELAKRLTADSQGLSRLVVSYSRTPHSDDVILDLNRRHQAMVARREKLQEQTIALTAHAAAQRAAGGQPDTGVDGSGAAGPQAAVDATGAAGPYAVPLAEADALLAYVNELDAEAEHTEMLLENAPVLAVEARKTIASAQATYTSAADEVGKIDEGGKVAATGDGDGKDRTAATGNAEPTGTVSPPSPRHRPLPPAATAFAFPLELVDRAEATLTTGDRIAAGRLAEAAADYSKRMGEFADELRSGEEAVGRTAQLFARIDDFAPSSWSDIRGNGSEAEESLDAAVALLGRLVADVPEAGAPPKAGGAVPDAGQSNTVAAVSPGEGQWTKAVARFGEGLAHAFDELARAKALLDAITERLKNLEAAKPSAAGQLAAVRRDLDAAKAWLAQPDVDSDVDAAPVQALAQVESELNDAESAMRGPQPDWLAIQRQIQRADQAVDQAVADARSQAERAVAGRRQVATAKVSAGAALDRAERYLAAHQGDIGSGAVDRLTNARDALRRAEAAASQSAGASGASGTAASGVLGTTATDAGAGGNAAWATILADYEQAGHLAEDAYTAMAADFARAETKRDAYVPRPNWVGRTSSLDPRAFPGGADIGGWIVGGLEQLQRQSSWGGRYGGSSRDAGGGGWPGGFGGGGSSGSRGGGGSSGGSIGGGGSSGGSSPGGSGGSSTRRGGGGGW